MHCAFCKIYNTMPPLAAADFRGNHRRGTPIRPSPVGCIRQLKPTGNVMPPSAANTRFRYTIFMLMVLVTIINYIDRGALSYAASLVTREYGLDKQSWGAVLG